MIAQLRGKLVTKSSTEIVVECGGVGYVASVSVSTAEKLPPLGSEVIVLTLLAVREDSMQLFGFINEAERDAFKQLISISGIGGKIALGILSSITIQELQEIIIRNDLLRLQKLPGVGRKTAERIIVELRDKIGKIAVTSASVDTTHNLTQAEVRQESLSALITLGYARPIAEKAIRQALIDEPNIIFTPDQLIRKALRNAAK